MEYKPHDITPKNTDWEILKTHFPQCFTKEGAFDFEKFKAEIAPTGENLSRESYGLHWLGKSYARLLATDKTTTFLTEDTAHNHLPENQNAENLLIKGDNLEVLKHLSNAYHSKIKMIYIDPPYNTGSDGFVYQDDRKFTSEQLQKLAGIEDYEAQRILEFTQSKSNSHSAWLTFMYPRLYIAKRLLTDDGVIFISIDDNEVAQLRLLCDEIFGEENFVGQITIVNNPRGRDYGGIANMHEYLLVYAKSSLTELNGLNDANKKFQYQDDLGGFELRELRNRNIAFTDENRPNLYYPFYLNPNNKLDNNLLEISLEKKEGYIKILPKQSQGFNTVWRWGKEKAQQNINVDIVGKEMKDGGYMIVEKYRKTTKMARSVWADKEDNSEKGTLLVKELFEGKKIFDFPKSRDMIKKIIEIGSNNNDIILDFFAGSGTTADAVMQLNREDGGNRKFILVQLPEPIDPKKNKTAYDFVKNELGVAQPTIFEITKERIIRASLTPTLSFGEGWGKSGKQENSQNLFDTTTPPPSEGGGGRIGFKIFSTTPIWEDYEEDYEEFDPQLALFDPENITEENIATLLTTWKTYDGIPLTLDLEKVDLEGYTAYYKNEKLYLMNKGFSTENLKSLVEKIDHDTDFNPLSVVAFGHHFESKALRELTENLKNYNNKKQSEENISVVIRY